MKKNSKNKKGFSFIEAILSVFILSTTMVAILGLMASNLKNSIDAVDQQIAGFLAQEGVELVRNIRDNNWKNNLASFNNFPPVGSSTGCRVDMNLNSSVITNCNPAQFNLKILSIVGGYYVHLPASGADTRFARKIDVAYTMDATGTIIEYATITSMVVWKITDFPAISGCNTAGQCAYTQVTLSKWGSRTGN